LTSTTLKKNVLITHNYYKRFMIEMQNQGIWDKSPMKMSPLEMSPNKGKIWKRAQRYIFK
jgi:hypothetical protein